MYHVEVRKVRANIVSSFLPESSRELGECLAKFLVRVGFRQGARAGKPDDEQ